jgi:hypothetical protein
MKKPINFKPLLFGALVIASGASYTYLSVQSNDTTDKNHTKLYEEKIILDEIESGSKLLPDVKLIEKIANIGKRLLPL